MCPGASPTSPSSPGVDNLDRWDVAVGTKAVPRRRGFESGGPKLHDRDERLPAARDDQEYHPLFINGLALPALRVAA
jgi:hypothetical protein